MNEADLTALWLTLRLAATTTLILLLFGTPLAWWLARTRFRFKVLIEAVVALPLVLPPTVLGFYLLLALGPRGPVGGLMESLGGRPLVRSLRAGGRLLAAQSFGDDPGDIGERQRAVVGHIGSEHQICPAELLRDSLTACDCHGL